jgi:hypothetical protein
MRSGELAHQGGDRGRGGRVVSARAWSIGKAMEMPGSHSQASPRMEKSKTTTMFSTFPHGSRDDSYGLCS